MLGVDLGKEIQERRECQQAAQHALSRVSRQA